MTRVLFLIHDLGQGGAEKVLVNLVNNMDRTKFDISVTVLFGGGVNEQFLKSDIHFRAIFSKEVPGNSKLMKLLSPKQLHRLCVSEKYDIEISYLEGPSARVISGCPNQDTKLVTWMHSTMCNLKDVTDAFRSLEETIHCYQQYDKIIAVSQGIRAAFCNLIGFSEKCDVLYNTVESEQIMSNSREPVFDVDFSEKTIKLLAVGSLKQVKGFKRLLNIIQRLKNENYDIHLYLLGKGPQRNELEECVVQNDLKDVVTFLGYQTNPYKYISKCDCFVCSSYSEGFSTSATEALIVGIPVCTVEVSGMREMLGNSEYGLITENSEEGLYQGIKKLLDAPELLVHYRKQAKRRGNFFSTAKTVEAVEQLLLKLV